MMLDWRAIDRSTKVEYYPYRTAIVPQDHRFLNIPRDEELEDLLVKMSGAPHRDNHVVYGMSLKTGGKLYISCSDSYIGIGDAIIVRNW